jgi:hypothetical protein
MEFLDPKKQQAHLIRLFIGYFLIGVAIILTTIILLYQAYGFGLKNGVVIQNGLIFMSSTPSGAEIYVNGQRRPETTNVRLRMPAGQYAFELRRDGYRSWKRAINIEGGTVARFDYPFLFPSRLTTTPTKAYETKPNLITQSPDQRWLLVQNAPVFTTFELFDLNAPDKPPVALNLPSTISTLSGTHTWKMVEWASDNRHVLLQHTTDRAGQKVSEYILADREAPESSVNLSTVLGLNPTKLTLRDKKYDKYFIYTAADQKLQTATLGTPAPQPLLEHVLDYKTYADGVVLYATADGAPAGKVLVKLREGTQVYTIRQVAVEGPYMLELTKYSGDWYVVAGASSESRTYVYKNPQAALSKQPGSPLVPVQVLKTARPTYVAFSDNARFIVAQAGQQFSMYDAENDRGYSYMAKAPMDAPQEHAEWMDGYRLMYVSGGKTFVFDFDNANRETLAAADSAYKPFFDRDFKVLYTLAPTTVKAADGKDVLQFSLGATSMRTAADK